MGPLLSQYFPTPSVWTSVFRALCEVTMKDDVLSQVVSTWRVWDGNPDDGQPPDTAEMPWIRLTPMRSTLRLMEVDANECPFAVKYEIAVRGTHYDDLANMMGAFFNALKYNKEFNDTVVVEYLRRAGAYDYEFETAANAAIRTEAAPAAPGQPGSGGVVTDQIAVGTIKIHMLIPNSV
jgi:hypothetical protein